MTKESMTIKDYNEAFLKGEVDESFIEERNNGIINLECNVCGSHVQQQDPERLGVIIKNCSSFMWATICDCCGIHQSRRTNVVPFFYDDNETTRKIIYDPK